MQGSLTPPRQFKRGSSPFLVFCPSFCFSPRRVNPSSLPYLLVSLPIYFSSPLSRSLASEKRCVLPPQQVWDRPQPKLSLWHFEHKTGLPKSTRYSATVLKPAADKQILITYPNSKNLGECFPNYHSLPLLPIGSRP